MQKSHQQNSTPLHQKKKGQKEQNEHNVSCHIFLFFNATRCQISVSNHVENSLCVIMQRIVLFVSLLFVSVKVFAVWPSKITNKALQLRRGSSSSALQVLATGTASSTATETSVDLPSLAELQEVLKIADIAARKAGILIRDNIGARVKYSKTNYKDVVTAIDLESQKVIESTINQAYPTHGFLGEESVEAGHCASVEALELILKTDSASSGWVWCVDPIDGTTNFASGLPLCVVSIGVAYKEQVVVGLIYNPVLEEMYTAIKGPY